MSLEITTETRLNAGGGAVAVAVGEDARALPRWTTDLPEGLTDCLFAALKSEGFTGKLGETVVVHSAHGAGILYGAGKTRGSDATSQVFGHLIGAASRAKLTRIVTPLPSGKDSQTSAEAAVVGAMLANYQFNSYLTDTKKRPTQVASLQLWEPDSKRRRAATRGLADGAIIAEATMRIRDLVNTPANDLTPESYAAIARTWCAEAGVKLQILGPSEITRAGMGAVMAVGRGSENTPRFLVATYLGQKRQPKKIDYALVGKGVTFDTGGISLKPSPKMWEMKGDMMGSAVMLTSICAAAKLKLPLNLVTLTPLVENMPSAGAYRPGDVVKTLSGQTIEINSTDAEGRLILADALTYAQRFQPKAILDIATLTGAMMIALGEACCAVFSDHDKLWRGLNRAGAATGERVWRMPLFEEYDMHLKSPVADMRNSGGREGGGCSAARLLQKFVGDYPWAHIDIAGVDQYQIARPCYPKGVTGFGARLMIQFLRG